MLTPHLTETYSQNYIDMSEEKITDYQKSLMGLIAHTLIEKGIAPIKALEWSKEIAELKKYLPPVDQHQQSPVKTLQECQEDFWNFGYGDYDLSTDNEDFDNLDQDVVNEIFKAGWEARERSQPVPVTEGREWVSVKDRLPENEQRIICLSKENRVKDRMYFDGDEVHFRDHFLGWMPLPSPPTH